MASDREDLNQLAIDMYSMALKLNEHFISSRFHLGLMYHKTMQYQDALKCFTKVLQKIPNDKTVYISRGLVYQEMGNHQYAIKDFNQAVALDETLTDGYYFRGLSRLSTRDYHDAAEDFRKSEDNLF